MKTIGLIGGMGWESSKLYYERLNKKANEVLGGSHSAKIIMVSVDFDEIEKLTHAHHWEGYSTNCEEQRKTIGTGRSGYGLTVYQSNSYC